MCNIDISSIFELNYTIENTFFSKINDDFEIKEGLKDTHIKALIIIKYGNGITMSETSHRLNLVKGAFTPVANRLIEFGLIEKIKSEKDKRVTHLVLTEEGESFSTDLLEVVSNGILAKVDKLSDEEKEAYFAAIKFVLSTTKKISD
ncbi:MarR family transcriptional regulator [Tepidibacter hydrothermalis]|uniref:MarR family transcriptional regulator n=1 Tax=Tepidibacter hydrothermalis TaxID=3036126 RepID=A0ABY8EB80_9FIRM|nr:MarR family transcriptional regulator [Tepidibacter hydrothermalis]WFD10206.1 MarR family transcriptional regulator [Tepidibacter hydrothermalis]